MSFNGSGTYSPPASSFPEQPDTLIDANRYDAVITDLAAGLTNAICKDGQTTLTANIPFNGFKATNMAQGTARTDSATLANIQDGTGVFVSIVGGTGDAISLGPSPAISTYTAGQMFRFVAVASNTTASTLSISGLAVKDLVKNGLTPLVAGDIPVGAIVDVTYDGTRFLLGSLGIGTLTALQTLPDNIFRVTGSGDVTKKLAFEVDGLTTATTRIATMPDFDLRLGNLPPGIGPLPYGGTSAPTGWLMFGADYSRTTYPALYAIVGSTFGAGDGVTTFGLHIEGRTLISTGTGTTTEISTSSSGNGFVVASNTAKWNTGMPIVLSAFSGFTSSATAGPTYYVVRISSTNIRLATTLALAQNLTPDVTVSGTGSSTLTYTMTTRTLGEVGGEQNHAMSSTELLAHPHVINLGEADTLAPNGGATNFSRANNQFGSQNPSTNSAGGNAAMNNMQPYLAVNFIITY